MERNPDVGVVGNGITEVFDNGDEQSEVLHESLRFRIDSLEGARIFRRRKSQLGTSRMTVRAEILRKIVPIPESIIIEADEYIFTLAAALSEASIVGEALTFYRIHAGNLYQMTGFRKDSVRRKQKSMESLASALSAGLIGLGIAKNVVDCVCEHVRVDADQLRLQIGDGYPWETVRTEWKLDRIVNDTASLTHRLFKIAALIPAMLVPPATYYSLRRKLAANELYLWTRKCFFPIPKPRHLIQTRRSGS
jgi:hypothetical protein